MKFHIVSDSSCDLGRERLERLGVSMVSFYAAFDDEVYFREERDIPTHRFYEMMAQRPGMFPKTSMPTMDDYLEAFRPLAAQGVPILCICLNAQFSGSWQSASSAAEELRFSSRYSTMPLGKLLMITEFFKLATPLIP